MGSGRAGGVPLPEQSPQSSSACVGTEGHMSCSRLSTHSRLCGGLGGEQEPHFPGHPGICRGDVLEPCHLSRSVLGVTPKHNLRAASQSSSAPTREGLSFVSVPAVPRDAPGACLLCVYGMGTAHQGTCWIWVQVLKDRAGITAWAWKVQNSFPLWHMDKISGSVPLTWRWLSTRLFQTLSRFQPW